MTDDEKRERVAFAMACPLRNGVDQVERWRSMSAERRNVWLIRAARAIDALEGTLPEDDEPCKAEVYSWSHFRQEMISPYWIRCTQLGTHDQHEDSRTGLKWGGV